MRSYITKLKTLLLFKMIFILVVITYVFYITNNQIYTSSYQGGEDELIGYINSIKIDGNTLSVDLITKEKVIVSYYIDTIEQLENIKKLQLGDKIKVKGTLEKPSDNRIFNLFNYKKYLLSKKTNWLFKAEKITLLSTNQKLRFKIKNLILKRISKMNTKDYLDAFVLGNSKQIDANVSDSFRQNGISHLLAVSGMHVSLLSGFLIKILKKIKYNYLIVALFLIFYMFLTNYTASVIRAVIISIILMINKKLNLKIKAINILILLAGILLLYNPYYIYDVGFCFSFTISFYLLLFQNLISRYKNYVTQLLIVSIIAFLAGLPIMIYNFHEINLLSPIINIIFVPFISIIIFPFSLLTFIFTPLDIILEKLIFVFESLSLLVSKIKVFNLVLIHPPFYIIVFYYVLVTFVLYKITLKKYHYILLIIVSLFIHTNIIYFNKYSYLSVIDVGQGDSILISLKHNQGNILIDTGGIKNYNQETWKQKINKYSLAKNSIIPYLKSQGIKKLDYLIITHGDDDHIGEAINLVNNFKVENVVFNCGSYNDLEKELIKVLEEKNIKYYSCIKELNIDKYKLEFLNKKEYDNENDNSNVIYFDYNNYKFLFMGDAGTTREKDILDKYNLSDVDFLKVGHHGSNTSSSEEFIDRINPKYSLISVGKNNRYGHPKKSVLDTLKESKIYRTDRDGSIEIKINENGYKISTCLS